MNIQWSQCRVTVLSVSILILPNLYYTCSSCDAYNMGVKDYLKEEIQGTYSDYTDDQVKRKLLHNL